MEHIVVVLPTYNESKNIGKLLETILYQQFFLSDSKLSVLVVDDSSPDGTGDIVTRYSQIYNNIHLLQGQKEGLGRAYKRGFEKAIYDLQADIIFMMDADFSHDPSLIPTFVKQLQSGYDFVIGSRYIPEGSVPTAWPWHRKINSKAGNIVARFIGGIKNVQDCTSGYRAISAKLLKKIDLETIGAKGYAVTIDILHQALQQKARVKEIPIHFIDRTHGESKMRLSDIAEFIVFAMKLRLSQHTSLLTSVKLVSFAAFVTAFYLLFKTFSFEVTFDWSTVLAVAIPLISFILTIQGLLTVWHMIYAWEDAEELEKNMSPKVFAHPYNSFTALIPARHESRVIAQTIEAVAAIDYPESLKEVLVICRTDDTATIHKAEAVINRLGKENIRLITFSEGRINKPHSLNIGLRHATKDVIVVFDAEDEPHKEIYNVTNTVMLRDNADVVQSGVQLMNYRSNWFSSLNVLEYFFWFKSTLHFFAKKGVIPLGGNSVFIKRSWLEKINGWDERCLTEDAEIGIRLSSKGANIRIIYDALHATQEETPHNTRSFIKQRTRWNQGFLQVLLKGEWLRLPRIEQRLLTLYILGWPLAQALLFFYVPLALYVAFTMNLPVGITMLTALPLYILVLQLVIYMIGLYEFTREYQLKFSLFTFILMLFVFLPFQLMLGIATFRAVTRMLFGNATWEKTLHINAHRKDDGVPDLVIPQISFAN